MAAQILTEAEIVQNAALAATMIWRCGIGYQAESAGRAMGMHVAFLVLPACLHGPTLSKLLSTQRGSGLSLFAAKLAHDREDLLSLHVRALSYRTLSLEAIGIGVLTRLLSVDYNLATLRGNASGWPRRRPERIRRLAQGAERLGNWCSRLTLEEITKILRIEF